jgi:lysozyme family protein
MKHNWEEALAHVLKHEGGYVNHPSDPGGMTNLGVTKRVWEEWVGHPVDEKAMRALTPELVAPMYKKKYWDVVRGDDLPTGVDLCVFDAAVNAGPGRASKFLQQAVGVTADGQIGPKTISAVTAKPADEIIEAFCALRESHYKSLNTFDTFGRGWMRRLASIKAESTDMA